MRDLSQVGRRIGTAGWSIPGSYREAFGHVDASARSSRDTGVVASHLEQYARRFSAVEINSSFHRHHRRETYQRWAATVASDFRFAVKLPRTITHDQSLVAFDAPLEVFLEEIDGLGHRLGPLLVQLPPSLQFDAGCAEEFFAGLRAVHGGDIVCEPRHATWFHHDADALLRRYSVARVAADPSCVPAAALPGGAAHLTYTRLHGSPDMYRSSYSPAFLANTAETLIAATSAGARVAWCIFDNTTLGAATGNALDLVTMIDERCGARPGPCDHSIAVARA